MAQVLVDNLHRTFHYDGDGDDDHHVCNHDHVRECERGLNRDYSFGQGK